MFVSLDEGAAIKPLCPGLKAAFAVYLCLPRSGGDALCDVPGLSRLMLIEVASKVIYVGV